MLRKQALNNLAIIVPKHRKPKFDFVLKIIDLTNVPLVAGTAYVKWSLSSSTTAETRGRTDRAVIREHKATWDYRKELSVRMTIEKTLQLQACELEFEILQEYQEGRGGRVTLGNVKLNLAEYTQLHEQSESEAGAQGEDEEGGCTRRYLLQDSKVNSTLKVGIKLTQTEGDTNFIAPPLKSAMVAGGIARIVNSGEAGEVGDDIPTISNKTRELTEAQDIYRRTLAATWACHIGEMPPDKLIEDLFAGGDGGVSIPPVMFEHSVFSKTLQNTNGSPRDQSHDSRSPGSPGSPGEVDSNHQTDQDLSKFLSPDSARRRTREGADSSSPYEGSTSPYSNQSPRSSQPNNIDQITSGNKCSIDQQIQQNHGHEQRRHHHHHHRSSKHSNVRNEYSEFDLRDDLKSWQIRVK